MRSKILEKLKYISNSKLDSKELSGSLYDMYKEESEEENLV